MSPSVVEVEYSIKQNANIPILFLPWMVLLPFFFFFGGGGGGGEGGGRGIK